MTTISNSDAAKMLKCCPSHVKRWLADRCAPAESGPMGGVRWPLDVVEIVAAERAVARESDPNRDRSYLLDSIRDCTDEEAWQSTRRQDNRAQDRAARRQEMARQIGQAPVTCADIDYLSTRSGERRGRGTVGATSVILARAKAKQ
jgi:hypothetical protein